MAQWEASEFEDCSVRLFHELERNMDGKKSEHGKDESEGKQNLITQEVR